MNAKPDEKRKSSSNSRNDGKNENTKRDEFPKKNDKRNSRESFNKPLNKARTHNSTNYGGFNRKNPYKGRQANIEETIDDIKIDIQRVEKEINLMIDEIKSMKL